MAEALQRNLGKLKAQMEELCKVKTINLELVSKLESIMTTYYLPASRHFETVSSKLLVLLNPEKKTEDVKTQEAVGAELDEYREACVIYQDKLKYFQSALADERSRKSLVGVQSTDDGKTVIHQT